MCFIRLIYIVVSATQTISFQIASAHCYSFYCYNDFRCIQGPSGQQPRSWLGHPVLNKVHIHSFIHSHIFWAQFAGTFSRSLHHQKYFSKSFSKLASFLNISLSLQKRSLNLEHRYKDTKWNVLVTPVHLERHHSFTWQGLRTVAKISQPSLVIHWS